MTSKKNISPFLSRALSSNGDSSSEDDDVFVNSRLDVISRNCDQIEDHSGYVHPDANSFLDFKMEQESIRSLFTLSPKGDENAVIFSVCFCGKYFGEVGLFEPDISILDWLGFKSYIFSSLNLESFDSYVISYCDEEGDKLPIESEEDYQEALKIAKLKANEEEKLSLYITRIGGGFQSSLRSLVSSSLRRVNSVGGGGTRTGTALQPQKKDVTTSTSFLSFDKESSNNSMELHSDEISPSYVPLHNSRELSTPQENYFGDTTQVYEKNVYDSPESGSHLPGNISQLYVSSAYLPTNNSWNADTAMTGRNLEASITGVPDWFRDYMKQFKEDLSIEVSSKIDERFEEAVGSISATDIASKLKGLLTGYSDPQNKGLCCCKNSNEPCQKSLQTQSSLGPEYGHHVGLEALGKLEREHLSTPVSVLKLDHREDSMDGDGTNSQDYFLQKLLKREQEILDFLDSTNEKIKQKIKDSSEYTDSLRSCLTKELAIEERERVLARIEDFRQRQNRTTNDIKMLQQSMEVNNEGILRLTSQEPLATPKKDFDAKFVKDLSFVDGSKVLPNHSFRKHWAVQNTGLKPWDRETFLVCQSSHRMKPFNDKVQCPPLMPGEVGRVSADFQAPLNPGIYSTEWRFVRCERLFGNHLWCSVIVPSEAGLASEEKDGRLVLESDLDPQSDIPYFSDYTEYFGDENFVQDHQSNGDSIENPQNLDDNENPPNKNDSKKPPNADDEDSKKTGVFPMHPLRQMTSEQLLWFLLYVFRITKPDFNYVRSTPVYKAVSNFLTRGTSRDFSNAFLMIENSFLENCAEGNLKLEEVINCYKDLFGTDEETEKRSTHVTFRYLHKMFSPPERGLENSDDEAAGDNFESDRLDNRQGQLLCEVSVDAATLLSEEAEGGRVPLDIKGSIVKGEEDMSVVVSERGRGQTNEDNPRPTGILDQEYEEKEVEGESNAVVVQKVLRFIETLNQNPYIRARDRLLTEMNEESDVLTRTDSERNSKFDLIVQSAIKIEDDSTVSKKEDESEIDHEDGNENERSFCRLNEDDCEDDVSSSYSEYSQSDSSLESEDEETSLKVIKDEGDAEKLHQIAQDFDHESEEDYNHEILHEDEEIECESEIEDEIEHESEIDDEIEHESENDEIESENEDEIDKEVEGEDEIEHETENEDADIDHETENEDVEIDRETENEDEEIDRETENEDAEIDHETENEDAEIDRETENEDAEIDRETENEDVEIDRETENEDAEIDRETENEDAEIDRESENEESAPQRKYEINHETEKDKFDRQNESQIDQENEDTEECSIAVLEDDSNYEEQHPLSSKEESKRGNLKLSSSDLRKDISSLHENFKQNVQVQLDFEVISRRPVLEEHVKEMESPSTSDPLTFQEKHFTVSSRPPPDPVKIPDSDDESFDGLVFIKDTDIASSVPPTEPCSPSNSQQPHNLLMDDSELSISCSSFSELDDEDEDDAGGGKSEQLDQPENLESSTHV